MHRIFLNCATLVALLLVTISATFGQQIAPRSADLDVVLVVKNSTSMRSSDPSFLARDLVLDFTARLAPDSRLGVVVFDQSAKLTVPLVDTATVAAIEQLAAGLDAISYTGRRAAISGGLERALEEFASNGRQGAGRGIVLITDGSTGDGGSPPDPEQEWLRLELLAQQCAEGGIRVFGIAFTGAADFTQVRAFVDRTGGEFVELDDVGRSGEVLARVAAKLRESSTEMQMAPDSPAVPARDEGPAEPEAGTGLWRIVIPVLATVLVVAVVAVVWKRRRRRRRPTPSPRKPAPVQVPRPSPVSLPRASLNDVAGAVLKQPYVLQEAVTRIGREPDNDLVIAETTVSAAHARIEYDGDCFVILDVGSSNGTCLNGDRLPVNEPRRLSGGDRITFDVYEFEFLREDEKAREPAAPVVAEAATTPRATPHPPESPPPEAGPPEAEPGPPGEPESEAPTPEPPGPATRLKPSTCPGHPEEPATELCTVCKGAFCARCVVEQDARTVCRSCADVPLSI